MHEKTVRKQVQLVLLSLLPLSSAFAQCEGESCSSRFGEALSLSLSDASETLSDRLRESRRINICGLSVKLGQCAKLLGGAAGAGEEGALLESSRISLIAFGDHSDYEREAQQIDDGYSEITDTINLGFDYRLTRDSVLGLTITSLSNETELDSNSGRQDGDGLLFGLHGSIYRGRVYLDARIAFGETDLDISRSDSGGDYRATTSASSVSLDLGAGYDTSRGRWRFSQFAGLSLTAGTIDAYTESANNKAGLRQSLSDQDIDSLALTIGLQADYANPTNWGVLIPTARFRVRSELGDAIAVRGETLQSDGTVVGAINSQGGEPDQGVVLFGLGLVGQFKRGWSAFVDSEYLAGHDYLSKFNISLGIRYEYH